MIELVQNVVGLFIDPQGFYPRVVKRWYDEERDAQNYIGPHPIVAHPPCGPWGSFAHFSKYQDPELALWAVDAVRKWGGVLEHPAQSGLWDACDLPAPGCDPDEFGGRSVEIDQVNFGHVARKRTWLYLVGIDGPIGPMPTKRKPTHIIGGDIRRVKEPGIRIAGENHRIRTPERLARWLVGLAQRVNMPTCSCGCEHLCGRISTNGELRCAECRMTLEWLW